MSNTFMGGGGTFDGGGASGNFTTSVSAGVDSAKSAALQAKEKLNASISGIHAGPNTPSAVPNVPGTPTLDLQNKEFDDAFSHDTDNNVSSTHTSDYKLDFEPNMLDQYDTYTYHWKFFITSLEDATSGNVLLLDRQTIIAESGVSDLTIDKVELHGIAVPSVEAGTGTQTLMKFEIVEPSGAGLFDKMYYQAVSLGIGNWLVMPCFLQLEFRGRDPVTSESITDGGPGSLSGLKWVWPIKLTNAKANVTNVGTRYEFDAIMYDELAQSNSYFAIQHNIVLKNLETFGDAMSALERKLNADQGKKLIDNYSIPDTYRIVVDPLLANEKIVISDKAASTYRGSDYVNLDKKTASFASGTGIDKIVDALCGSMDYFQKKMQDANTRDAQPNPTTGEVNQMKKLWRVVTETKPIAFDLVRQDNAVAITVYVIEYDLGAVDVDAAQTGQTDDALPAAKKRFGEYSKKKIMKKKYNYIFTGLNDQVITLDLNMNFSFAASLSRFGGIYYDSQKSDMGLKAQDHIKNEAELSNQLRETIDFINDSEDPKEVNAKVAQTQKSIEAAQVDPLVKEKYKNILKYQQNPDHLASAAAIAKAGGVNAAGATTDTPFAAASLAAPQSGTNSNGDNINLHFITDVDIYSPDAQNADKTLKNLRKGKLRPVPYRENTQEANLIMGIDSTSDAGRARVSSVFATALYSTLDASLQTLKITVKGDPYWLFPRSVTGSVDVLPYKSNMADGTAIDEIKNSHINYPGSVNLFGTDNFIVVRFRTPRIYNITDEPNDPNTEVNAFSGVYKVITIVSKFDMGKFVQELSCILDPVIDLQDFLKDIEESVKHPDVVATPQPSSIDSKHIKTDKIMGGLDAIKGQVATVRNQAGNVVNQAQSSIGSAVNSATSNIPTLSAPTPDQIVSQITTAAGRG